MIKALRSDWEHENFSLRRRHELKKREREIAWNTWMRVPWREREREIVRKRSHDSLSKRYHKDKENREEIKIWKKLKRKK